MGLLNLNCKQGQQFLSEKIEPMEALIQDLQEHDRGPSSPGGTIWVATKQQPCNLQHPARATAGEKQDDIVENIESSRVTDKVTSMAVPARSRQAVSFYGRDPRSAGYSFNNADLSAMSQEEFANQIMKHQNEANKVFGGHKSESGTGWSLSLPPLLGGTSPQKLNAGLKIFTEQNEKTEHQVESKGFKEYKEQEKALAPGALSQDSMLEKAMQYKDFKEGNAYAFAPGALSQDVIEKAMTERNGNLKIFKEQNDKTDHQVESKGFKEYKEQVSAFAPGAFSQDAILEKAMTERTVDLKIFKEQNDKTEHQVESKGFKEYKEQVSAFAPGAFSQDAIYEKATAERTVDVKSFKEHNDKTEHQVESKGFKEYKEQEHAFKKKGFSPKTLSQDAILANAMKKQQKGMFF
jgi:hypothetical protein